MKAETLEELREKIKASKSKIVPYSTTVTQTFPNTLLLHRSPTRSIYALPQDNMPCIVPEMKQFNMPVAGNADMLKKRGGIPILQIKYQRQISKNNPTKNAGSNQKF